MRAPVLTFSWAFEPTERALWALALVCALGLFSSAEPNASAATVAALALLVIGMIVDAAFSLDPGKVRVTRETDTAWKQGARTMTSLTLTVPGRAELVVTDTLPDDASPRTVTHAVSCAPGLTTVSHAATIVRRGRFAFGRVAVRTLGPLGLMRRRARHVVVTTITVEPDLVRVQNDAARLTGGSGAEGARRRRAAAEGRELDALREYARGDDVRLVEWKATARRGTLIVKTMRPESRQDVLLLVDSGRQLMGALGEEDGGAMRIDAAVTGALVVGAAALSLGDRVTAIPFAADVRGLAVARGGRGTLRALGDALSLIDARPEAPDYLSIAQVILARQKRRALAIFFTDVTDESAARALIAAVARLSQRHVPMIVAIGDPAWWRLRERSEDGALVLAAERTLSHRRRALAALGRSGAIIVDATSTNAAPLATAAYLRAKSLGRI
jgi:uncharacterized protein (DUF58 family)